MRRPRASDELLVELFLDMLAAERGAGENTLTAYRHDLDDLSAHLRAAGRTIAKATTDDLRDFIANLSERGFKASSLARRLSAVRQLYNFSTRKESASTTRPRFWKDQSARARCPRCFRSRMSTRS